MWKLLVLSLFSLTAALNASGPQTGDAKGTYQPGDEADEDDEDDDDQDVIYVDENAEDEEEDGDEDEEEGEGE